MLEKIINLALEEDLGGVGDVTSICIPNNKVKFGIFARENLIFCGGLCVAVFAHLFSKDGLILKTLVSDGDRVDKGTCLVSGEGNVVNVFSIERTLLNFLQRSSGIPTTTRSFVDAVAGTKAIIRSTRKTCPGLRKFDLYSLKVGGGSSFRQGLFDGVMIKDNHIAHCHGITQCVSSVRSKLGEVLITVECDTIDQVLEAVSNNVHTLLLDNMSLENIKHAIHIVDGRAKIEASGGVNLDNVREIALCGVDYISVGCITNSVICKDIGLDVIERML